MTVTVIFDAKRIKAPATRLHDHDRRYSALFTCIGIRAHDILRKVCALIPIFKCKTKT